MSQEQEAQSHFEQKISKLDLAHKKLGRRYRRKRCSLLHVLITQASSKRIVLNVPPVPYQKAKERLEKTRTRPQDIPGLLEMPGLQTDV